MNTRTRIAVSAFALVSAALSGVVSADTVDLRYTGSGRGRIVQISHPGGGANVFSGQLTHNIINPVGSQAAAIAGVHNTFCTDVSQYVTRDFRSYTLTNIANVPNVSPMGTARAAAIQDVYDYAGVNILSGATTNDAAAAFQLLVWEIIHDYSPTGGLASLSLSSGAFRAATTSGNALGTGIMSQFNTFVASIGAVNATRFNLVGLTNGEAQDQIVALAIPAPGPVALAGLGALCFAGRRRGKTV